MSWKLVLWKGIKYFLVAIVAGLLGGLTPEVLTNALSHLPFGLGTLLVPVFTGLISAAINAVKHWNDTNA